MDTRLCIYFILENAEYLPLEESVEKTVVDRTDMIVCEERVYKAGGFGEDSTRGEHVFLVRHVCERPVRHKLTNQ